MGERNPDDIMAECLLTGGKMLSKACRACGSPLFEVKGETLCVVCREKGKEKGKGAGKGGPAPATPPVPPATAPAATGGAGAAATGEESDEVKELRLAIAVFARRAREETDPERSRTLMEAARNGALALSLLQR